MKRIVALVLALCMLVGSACAVEIKKVDDQTLIEQHLAIVNEMMHRQVSESDAVLYDENGMTLSISKTPYSYEALATCVGIDFIFLNQSAYNVEVTFENAKIDGWQADIIGLGLIVGSMANDGKNMLLSSSKPWNGESCLFQADVVIKYNEGKEKKKIAIPLSIMIDPRK